MFTTANSNGADGGRLRAACLSYVFLVIFRLCNVTGIHWYGCSVQNLWDFFDDVLDCMESVLR